MTVTIKRKVFLVNMTVFLIALAFGAYLIRSYQMVPRHLAATQQVNQLVYELSLLNLAVINFQFREVERATQQWSSISSNVKGYLRSLETFSTSKRHLIDLKETHESVNRLFIRLLDETRPPSADLRNHLSSLVSAKVFDMIMSANLLLSDMEEKLKEANQKASYSIILFTAVMVLTALNLQFFFRRTVVKPLNNLEKGVKLIGEGNLDVRVSDHAQDEIGQLGLSINRMSSNLRTLTKSKEEFLSTAAHELKTPLTVLKTTAQLMMDMSREETLEFLPYALKTLNRQCDHLNKLVVDVLEVSRLELENLSLNVSEFDLNLLVKKVCVEMQILSDRHPIKVTQNDRVKIKGDQNRIEQVLVNLIDNAMKYSPQGGPIELRSELKGDRVEVSVADKGIGIPKEKQSRIFERFFRAHADTPYGQVTSLGVGLFLSRQFVERHGGEISFTSSPGEGSKFFFSLPVARDQNTRDSKKGDQNERQKSFSG